jgi:hypothetical protein
VEINMTTKATLVNKYSKYFPGRHAQLRTDSDRYDNCKTIAPSRKRFYGFYGRAGAAIDLAGTIWGDL